MMSLGLEGLFKFHVQEAEMLDIVQSQITDYVKYINYMLRHDQK